MDCLAWSLDDSFLFVAFRNGCLSVFTRLGDPIALVLNN